MPGEGGGAPVYDHRAAGEKIVRLVHAVQQPDAQPGHRVFQLELQSFHPPGGRAAGGQARKRRLAHDNAVPDIVQIHRAVPGGQAGKAKIARAAARILLREGIQRKIPPGVPRGVGRKRALGAGEKAAHVRIADFGAIIQMHEVRLVGDLDVVGGGARFQLEHAPLELDGHSGTVPFWHCFLYRIETGARRQYGREKTKNNSPRTKKVRVAGAPRRFYNGNRRDQI